MVEETEMFNRLKHLALVLIAAAGLAACEPVPAGYVGVKVYMLGGNKGVDSEELGVGRYWIGWNEQLFLFPTFTQNEVWTADNRAGSPTDESISFQDVDGLRINGDFGIQYRVDPTKVTAVFQKYRRGITEITDVFLYNEVRDALNSEASKRTAEVIYGRGKDEMMAAVKKRVAEAVASDGIIVENIYVIGTLRLPEAVIAAINAKIAAIQRAQQRENEVAEQKAMAAKAVADAEGFAQSTLLKAKSQAQANRILAESLTSELVQYEALQKWNGILPNVTGASVPFINIK